MSIRNAIARRVTALGNKLSSEYKGIRSDIPEISDGDMALLESIRGLSMTAPIAQWEFIRALRYIDALNIEGAVVECGVWRGGNLALAGLIRRETNNDRQIFAYDTFAGMTAPTPHDHKAVNEVDTQAKFDALERDGHNDWCYASLDDVRNNFAQVVGAEAQLRTIVGPVQDTLIDETNLPEKIAILRLDTDFYDSTKAEMEILYPRLVSGGILIVDDYGEWAGARKAVDEYFADQHVWLLRVTHTVRMMFKR
ncbi:TylF/MycF/NovP-related O-methyltransferase [Qipengyuania sp. YIM B01966]|uniref:TylF/MycF/NovP-related O-methyltransferase n=1 Tax=Qipengyuania sp. YIM B01966 TaxID=2778646 RepID=UPI0018F4D870|nr:TylF/MycF/NovP-related O-methyltransferase [Qipengyuania sp. YIM B01966]